MYLLETLNMWKYADRRYTDNLLIAPELFCDIQVHMACQQFKILIHNNSVTWWKENSQHYFDRISLHFVLVYAGGGRETGVPTETQ